MCSSDLTVHDLAIEALLRTAQHEFPVVDDTDRLLGVLTRDDMIAALKRRGSGTPVVEVMHRDLPAVGPHDPFDEAFRLMQQSASPALPVVNRSGRFLGLITPENVGEMMLVHALRPHSGRPTWRSAGAI